MLGQDEFRTWLEGLVLQLDDSEVNFRVQGRVQILLCQQFGRSTLEAICTGESEVRDRVLEMVVQQIYGNPDVLRPQVLRVCQHIWMQWCFRNQEEGMALNMAADEALEVESWTEALTPSPSLVGRGEPEGAGAIVGVGSIEQVLALLDKQEAALARADSLTQVQRILNQAEALRLLLGKAGASLRLQNRAARMRLKSERTIGQMLLQLPKSKGAATRSHDEIALPTLAELGIERNKAHRYQLLAAIPDADFDDELQAIELAEVEITSRHFVSLGKHFKAYSNQGDKTPPRPRIENDFYETPSELTKELILRCNYIKGQIFEPCAGNLAISQHFNGAMTNDFDPQRPTDFHFDATDADGWISMLEEGGRVDWVVTNPPFGAALEILRNGFDFCDGGLAALLRLSFLEPTGTDGRGAWLEATADHLRDVILFSPRPQFREDGGADSVTVAWLVWDKAWSWEASGVRCPWFFVGGWR